MPKKKCKKKKSNKLNKRKRSIYQDGGLLDNADLTHKDYLKIGNGVGNMATTMATAAQSNSGVGMGDVVSGLGGIASALPIPGAGIVGGVVSGIGGIISAKEQAKEQERMQEQAMRNQINGASLSKDMANAKRRRDVYEDGGDLPPEYLDQLKWFDKYTKSKKFRERYEKGLIPEPLQDKPDEDLNWLLNNIASNNTQQPITYAKYGGTMKLKDGGNININKYKGAKHEQGGIPINDQVEVEDGETRGIGATKDYIFSDTLKNPATKNTFAEDSEKIEKKYKGMDNDDIALKSKDRELSDLRNIQENVKQKKFLRQYKKMLKKYPEQMRQVTQAQQPNPQQQNQQAPQGMHQMPNGEMMQGNTHQEAMQQGVYAYGGDLYKKPDPDDPPTGFDRNKAIRVSSKDELKNYTQTGTADDGSYSWGYTPGVQDATVVASKTKGDVNKDAALKSWINHGYYSPEDVKNYGNDIYNFHNTKGSPYERKKLGLSLWKKPEMAIYEDDSNQPPENIKDSGTILETDKGLDYNLIPTEKEKLKRVPAPDNKIYGNQKSKLGYGNTDWLSVGASAIPGALQAAGLYRMAQNLDYKPMGVQTYQPDYVDPTRAAQEVREQFGRVKDTTRQVSSGAGNYMSNLIGATANESRQLSGVYNQYDNTNAQISNQADQFNTTALNRAEQVNAQIRNQEIRDKTGLKQNALSSGVGALENAFQTYQIDKRNRDMLNIAGGENFYIRHVGNTPVKVFKGYGYEYYDDPETGERVFLQGNEQAVMDAQDRKTNVVSSQDNTQQNTTTQGSRGIYNNTDPYSGIDFKDEQLIAPDMTSQTRFKLNEGEYYGQDEFRLNKEDIQQYNTLLRGLPNEADKNMVIELLGKKKPEDWNDVDQQVWDTLVKRSKMNQSKN